MIHNPINNTANTLQKSLKTAVCALVLLTPPPALAERPYVAIAGIEIAAPDVQCEYWYGSPSNRNSCFDDIIKGFSKMLETAIVKTNKMAVYEREQLDPVLSEQLAGAAGLTGGKARVGDLAGIDYVVSGSITKFGGKTEESGVSGEVLGLFGSGSGQGVLSKGVKQTKTTFIMAVDIKIVDTTTGRIVAAETVEAEIIAGESSSIAGLGSSEQKAAPLSDVARDVARKIATVIVTNKFPIRVISFKDGIASLNYNDSVLSLGQCLNVYSLGDEIVDPDTGETLGSEESLKGQIAITETNAKFSKAEAVTDGFTPKKGMVGRSAECDSDKKKQAVVKEKLSNSGNKGAKW